MPMEAQHEEMGTDSRVGRRSVDGVRALQQIVTPSEGEQLSGSLCGKGGELQGHRPVCWDRSRFQYLAGADKCFGMDCGGSCRPIDYSLAVTIRPMSAMAILHQQPRLLPDLNSFRHESALRQRLSLLRWDRALLVTHIAWGKLDRNSLAVVGISHNSDRIVTMAFQILPRQTILRCDPDRCAERRRRLRYSAQSIPHTEHHQSIRPHHT
jgi:hypothetical protein